MNSPHFPSKATLLAALLSLATLAVFGGVVQNGFVNFDDGVYLLKNPRMQSKITLESLSWAFTTFDASNWHPLTWLSHLLDVQLFGMQPAGHHLMSALLHSASAALLFLALSGMTGALLPSAFVAAIFALHPLRVESVAWAAERKDVLSGLFWMLGLLAYLRYLHRPGAGRYLSVVAIFGLGLLSKPMVVTFPFVLLLLDVWPFGRMTPGGTPGRSSQNRVHVLARLLLEKIPLLTLSAAVSVVTYLAQRGGGAMSLDEIFHVGARYSNALASYGWYLQKFFWPVDLAVYYPMSLRGLPHATIIATALLLVTLCSAVLFQWRRRPYLAVGWFWFLGTLVPVVGFVKAGVQSTADRYTYLPLIGVSLALTWMAVEFSQRRPRLRGASAALILLVLAAATVRQIGYWKNSTSLWEHAVLATERNWFALNSYAVELMREGKDGEAITYLLEAESYYPDPTILANLGLLFERRGDMAKAGNWYSRALAGGHAPPEVHYGLGNVLFRQNKLEDAAREYREAIRLLPTHSEAWNNLAVVLAQLGRPEEASRSYEEAIRTNPANINARNNYGVDLFRRGRIDEAIREYREALRLKPDNIASMLNLADALLAQGRREEARQWHREALRLDPGNARARASIQDYDRSSAGK